MSMDQNIVNQYMQSAKSGGGQFESPYLKLSAGQHAIRILPAGNNIEPIFFRKVVQHTAQYGPNDADFSLCWNHIAQNISTVAQPLVQEGKLTKQDMNLYQQFGCPFCKFVDFLSGVPNIEKEFLYKIKPSDKYLWNVVQRTNGGGVVRVWSQSTKLWKTTMNVITSFAERGADMLDPNIGYDFILVADGEGFNRRYPSLYPMPQSCPANIPAGQQIFNLVEISNHSFQNYQQTINILKKMHGQLMLQMGYKIPGDAAVAVAPPPSVFPNPNTPVVPVPMINTQPPQYSNAFPPQNPTIQPPNPMQPFTPANQAQYQQQNPYPQMANPSQPLPTYAQQNFQPPVNAQPISFNSTAEYEAWLAQQQGQQSQTMPQQIAQQHNPPASNVAPWEQQPQSTQAQPIPTDNVVIKDGVLYDATTGQKLF